MQRGLTHVSSEEKATTRWTGKHFIVKFRWRTLPSATHLQGYTPPPKRGFYKKVALNVLSELIKSEVFQQIVKFRWRIFPSAIHL